MKVDTQKKHGILRKYLIIKLEPSKPAERTKDVRYRILKRNLKVNKH